MFLVREAAVPYGFSNETPFPAFDFCSFKLWLQHSVKYITVVFINFIMRLTFKCSGRNEMDECHSGWPFETITGRSSKRMSKFVGKDFKIAHN